VVDEVLVAYLAGPRTYTREDIIEINWPSSASWGWLCATVPAWPTPVSSP
jgi:hypothetical protein